MLLGIAVPCTSGSYKGTIVIKTLKETEDKAINTCLLIEHFVNFFKLQINTLALITYQGDVQVMLARER